MRFNICRICKGILCVLLLSFSVFAADFESWIPILPETINGLEKADSPDGANVNKGGKSWTTLQQRYSGDSGKNLRLTIVDGSIAPQIQQFKSMKRFTVETENKLIESVDISGYESVIEIDKTGGSSSLLILVREERIVVIDTNAVSNKEELISLAEDISLSDIASK